MRYIFYLSLALILSGCLEEAENTVSCGLSFSEDLLNNPPPSDSVYFRIIESSNPAFIDSWYGIVDQEATDSTGATTYENLLLQNRRPVNLLTTLNGLGIEISDLADSTSIILSFDFVETSNLERVCRYNKTLREEHFYSNWENNKEGSRIDVSIRENDELVFYSTDFEQEDDDDFKVFLSGIEFFDETRIFGLVKGTFRAKIVNDENEDSAPVTIAGKFQTIVQTSFGTTEF